MLKNFRLRRHHLRGLDGRVRGVPVRGAKGENSHGTRKFKWKNYLKKSARIRLLCLADNFRERDRRGVHGLPAVRHHWRAGARLPRRVRERGRLPGETNFDTSFEFPSTKNQFFYFIQDFSSGDCPVEAGEQITYDLELFIAQTYPAVSL